jgi:hypothetical protein
LILKGVSETAIFGFVGDFVLTHDLILLMAL